MMDLVVKITKMQAFFVAKQHALEPGMAGDGQEPIEHQMEDHMDRVRRKREVNQNRAKIEKMFDRMHGQAGPGADIGIPVVQSVKAVHDIGV